MSNNKVPQLLLVTYLLLFVVLAIAPYDRAVWLVENIPVWVVVGLLVLTFKRFRFSNTAYFLMWFFLCYHTVGGHFTFELTPFAWGNHLLSIFNFDFVLPEGRNNFDRLGHFLVGVFSYPIVEVSLRKQWVKSKMIAFFLAVFALGFWAASYEVVEMYYAVLEGGESGAAFLGSQGDVWDAQKDMLLDICGAVLFALLALFRNYRRS